MSNRLIAFLAAIAVVIAATAGFLLFTGFGSGSGGTKPTSAAGSGCNAAVFGKVVTSDGKPIPQAQITVSGPFKSTEAASRFSGPTSDAGMYLIGLPIGGDYEIQVDGWGFVPSHLVGFSRQQAGSAPEVKCEPTAVQDIVLKTLEQFTPARGTDGFVYGQGVQKEDVCRALMSHNLIGSCDEFTEPQPVEKSGAGWTTFIRDGQSISTVPVTYHNEPFWQVTFKSPRPDGLTTVFVQRKCGNVSAPPGKAMPPPVPGKEVPPSATPTSPTVSPTSPPATNTPLCNCTPVPPTATPPKVTVTPQPPQTPAATFTPPPSGCPGQPACPGDGFHFPTVVPTPGQPNPTPEATVIVPPATTPTGVAAYPTEVVRP